MAGKKKKGKKKKKGAKKAGPAKLILPNFVPVHRTKMPLAIHVHHLDDMFLIYSDEYDESQKILEEIAKILNVEVTDLRLHFSNKRRVELDTVNHDQQIVHNVHLYLTMKKDDQWENVKDILGSSRMSTWEALASTWAASRPRRMSTLPPLLKP